MKNISANDFTTTTTEEYRDAFRSKVIMVVLRHCTHPCKCHLNNCSLHLYCYLDSRLNLARKLCPPDNPSTGQSECVSDT